jgi:hypothetical protein
MPKTARAEHTAPLPVPTSPARHDLAEMLLDMRDAERKAQAARVPVARLEAEIAGEAEARAQLEALDTDYAARMAAWAGSGAGNAPDPNLEARRVAKNALDAATLRADAARGALAAVRETIAAADARAGDSHERIRPAVAGVLREEGRWMIAEYWRRYAELEQVRRELAALDQVLLTDFPLTHAPTGQTIVDWISPDKLPAQAALRAIDTACANLDGVQDFTRHWREKAAELAR